MIGNWRDLTASSMSTLLIKANLGVRMCQISGPSASCKGPLHLPPHLALHNATVTILLSTFWLHCHLPFVAEKMLCKHSCFLSRENDTLLPALCCRENVTPAQVLSIEGKWYTTIHPLSQRKCYVSTIAFYQEKMIHCHLPFVTEKRFCKYGSFLSSKNDTSIPVLCPRENVLQAQCLSPTRKFFVTMATFHSVKILCWHESFVRKENVWIQFILS